MGIELSLGWESDRIEEGVGGGGLFYFVLFF